MSDSSCVCERLVSALGKATSHTAAAAVSLLILLIPVSASWRQVAIDEEHGKSAQWF